MASAQDDEGDDEVITPENANPTEQYNLPPNFDPNFRPKRTPASQKVTLDFRQAQLDEVVKMFSSVMDKNFIISDSVNTSKTITIISPEPVSVGEAYRAFLAALQMNGLTVVPFGSFLKIVESKNAIVEPMEPIGEGERIPNEARMVTAIIPVVNSNIDEVQEVIGKFVTPDATIIPYGSNLIITENAANLRRIQNLIQRLDRGDAADKVYVYKVLYADASEIKTKLEEIFQAQTSGSSSRRRRNAKNNKESESAELDVELSEIIADERTNQLIVVSTKRSFDKVKEMIDILDVPTAVGGQIHVKFLEYANAEELSGTLSSLASGGSSSSSSSQNRARAARQRARQAQEGAQGGDVADLLQGDVQITSHQPTNSLVVVASPRDYLALESVIDLLDRPRKQVYVEAVIMEIGLDVNRNVNLGFNAGLGQDFDGVIPDSAVENGLVSDTRGLMLGQANFQGIESALGGVGGAIGLLGPLVQIPGTSISLPAFALLLQATQTDTTVNVLSTPAVMTMDNEEAEITVGERIAFQRGVTAGSGGGLSSLLGAATAAGGQDAAGLAGLAGLSGLGSSLGGLIAPIDYQDVGITLRILPQVNESNYVRLEVDQEVSDIKGAGSIQGAPDRTQRSVKTIVLVKDQSTVVIGGLIRDVENQTIDKVPFLGDIPLIGVLFRNTGTIKTKQNLVLMLTPYIIESESDLQKIRERKMKEREELLKVFGRRDLGYMKSVNFDKKSGLFNRMKQQIQEAAEEKEARDAALEAFEEDGPRYRLLGGDEEEEADEGERPIRERLPDGGVRFDPEATAEEAEEEGSE
jgi:general secretion pathway protein D